MIPSLNRPTPSPIRAADRRVSRAHRRQVRARRRAEQRFAPSQAYALPEAIAHAMLRRALRPIAELWADLPMIIALELPDGMTCADVTDELRRIGAGIGAKSRHGLVPATEVVEAESSSPKRRRKGASALHFAIVTAMRSHRRLFVTIEAGIPLPQDVLPLIDHRVAVAAPTTQQLAGLIGHRLGLALDPTTVAALASLRFAELSHVLRSGTDRGQIERRLARHLSSREAQNRTVAGGVLDLVALPGMGAATQWGLDLADDLAAWAAGRLPWRDVDRGLLLHGQPGTGKTTFARALAATCNVPLIVGSFARWQAAGHLGDMLAAMRRSFDEALDKVPSILFIDELDSVGDRATFSGDSKGYQTEVVNALLECLDGVEGRDGLVVVGACNHPHLIDPAVLRSGRMDRLIEIRLPDAAARLAILRLHLLGDLIDADLAGVVRRTEGWSGADLERLIRDGRRRARKARLPLQCADLEAGLPRLHRPSAEEFRRMAIHEVGHAIVATVVGGQSIDRVWIERELAVDGPQTGAVTGGGMRLQQRIQTLRTDVDHSQELTLLLAGRAAEEVMLGTRSDGAAGGPGSDLYRATTLAARLEIQLGLGPAPIHLGARSDDELLKLIAETPDLRGRVEHRLADHYAAAKAILAGRREVIEVLAEELEREAMITGERVSEVVGELGAGERRDRERVGGLLQT